jgi:hypothetical protein
MLLKWFICGMGGSICLAHFIWEELMLLSCIMHSLFIAWKFIVILWSDRTGTLSIICLPEKGYDAASYPQRYEGRSHYCICSHVHSWERCGIYYVDVDSVDFYIVILLGFK